MRHRSILTSLFLLPLAACAGTNSSGTPSEGTSTPTETASSVTSVAPTSSTSVGPVAQPSNTVSPGDDVGPAGGVNPGSASGSVGATDPGAGTGATGGSDATASTDGTGAPGGTGDTGGTNSVAMSDAGGEGGDAGASGAVTSTGSDADASTPAVSPSGASAEDIDCERTFSVPSFAELMDNPKMPDPFTFLDGTRVETVADWVCRQKEISLLAQAFIYGPKPPKPETLEATFNDGMLTVEMAEGGRTYSFSVSITVPNGEGPFPGVFNVDGGGSGGGGGVATIGTSLQWLTSNVAAAGMGRNSKGGEFYAFHPDFGDTGSLMAWAWAASRIIDGLELTAPQHNIDTTKLWGLGCSRNGKTAATMALFDRRMAMVAMYSPGSGTTSGWRPAEAQTSDVQTASQIFGETTWMGEPFGQFGNQVNKLPIDQHEVLALAWPRPLLVREGTNDSWNCPVCVYTTVKYTQMIFEALGTKDRVGFTHYNGGHCEAGGAEWSGLYSAYVDKYINGDESVSTEGLFTESFDFDAAKWQDGELPAQL